MSDEAQTTNEDEKNKEQSVNPTKSASHSLDAHMIVGVNRDILAMPNIENIIEEDEEEEEDDDDDDDDSDEDEEDEEEKEQQPKETNSNSTKIDDVTTNNNNKNIIENEKIKELKIKTPNKTVQQNSSSPQHQQHVHHHVESSKFTLETVILDSNNLPNNNLNNKKLTSNEKQFNENNPSEPMTTKTQKPTLLSNNLQNNNQSADNNEDNSDVVEIKVEEGYATRQMDEYFRQTIAAIKEELTKKLENKNEQGHSNHHHHHHNHHHKHHRHHHNHHYHNYRNPNDDIDEYDSQSDYDDENIDDHDPDNEHHETHLDDMDNSNYSKCECDCCEPNRNNRNLLYQHLVSLSKKKPTKKDKITSWLVLFGCFLNQFIIDGLCYNYANLFEFIQKEFKDSSRLIASMPGTFLIGFYLLLAPISIFLTKQYGTRRIALIGSFISTISLLISSFLTNIVAFTIFYGVFTGIGISLIYIPSIIATSKWFFKKRLFANSLAVLGACLGAAIYPLFSEFILRKYGLFDCLLILSGVQFNCLVGSMLLKDHKTSFSLSYSNKIRNKKNHQKFTNKHKSPSSALLIENDKNEQNETNNNIENNHLKIKMNNKMSNRRRLLSGDSETESTTSVSTSTVTNYTLKQYWRKFIQTRKTQANTKKNLFHLIAEEKRKTRTLSKTSLEDGFVITTSNNLLAPNDESHVIVTRQTKLAMTNNTNTQSSRAASRFFTRIANSLRSLAHSNNTNQSTNSPINTTIHSKINIPTPSLNVQEINEAPKSNNQQRSPPSSTEVKYAENNSNNNNNQISTPSSPTPIIPLMSVFNGPINDATNQTQSATNAAANTSNNNNNNNNNNANEQSDSTQIPSQLVNVFINDQSNDNKSPTMIQNNDQQNVNINSVYDDNSDSDEDSTPPSNYFASNLNKVNTGLKNSRYLSYRNSLTNSVRGSLMECSVPEDREDDDGEINSGGDGNSSVNEDDEMYNSADHRNNVNRRYSQRQPKRRSNLSGRSASYHCKVNRFSHTNTNTMSTSNQNESKANGNLSSYKTSETNGMSVDMNNGVGYAMPSLINLRRFVSITESSSFFNVPLNLESIEYNLRNSLIKKCSDNYRKQQRLNRNNSESKSTLFLDYLSYLTSFKLFKNKLLFLLNFSFLLNIIGLTVVLVYISDYCMKSGLNKTQSIYILCLIGLMIGLGRIISTISYKVNESNAKSRIFAYILTLLLNGICIGTATILCDTVFSFSMFAITFGILIGFNMNLRSLFIYDIIGLEWSDDSLFFYSVLIQSAGVTIGLPLAGLIYDIFRDHLYVFYFAGLCFILSGLILTPGRKFRSYFKSSFKKLNKLYLQRKS